MLDSYNVNETLGILSRKNLTGTKHDQLNQRARLYSLIYDNHFNFLRNIVSGRHVWKNLPKYSMGKVERQIRSSFIEFQLSFQGSLCCCKLDELPVVIFTPCTVEGLYNIYGDPTNLVLSPPFGTSDTTVLGKHINIDETVFIYGRNDNLATGFQPYIEETAHLLTSLLMSAFVNANAQKFPTMIKSSKNQKLSMDILTNKVDGWEDYIVVKDGEGWDSVKDHEIFNRQIPYKGNELLQTYEKIYNIFLSRIGVNNLLEKQERMLVDEVNTNNQSIRVSESVYLQNRIEFCKGVNDAFGLSISVEENSGFVESLKNLDVEKRVDEIKGVLLDE